MTGVGREGELNGWWWWGDVGWREENLRRRWGVRRAGDRVRGGGDGGKRGDVRGENDENKNMWTSLRKGGLESRGLKRGGGGAVEMR